MVPPADSLTKQLAGAWRLISWEQTGTDGSKLQQFGENPKGLAFFDASGHYIISVMRSDRMNYKIDNFGQIAQISPEEARATALGTITYFGTYTVDEANRGIAIDVEGSSFPNWNGTRQQRFCEIVGHRLKLTVRPSAGGHVDVVWKRARQ